MSDAIKRSMAMLDDIEAQADFAIAEKAAIRAQIASFPAQIDAAVLAERARLMTWVNQRRSEILTCADLHASEESAAILWLDQFSAAIRARMKGGE